MHLSLLPGSLSSAGLECAPGHGYFSCAVNNFTGCCSIDPCGLTNGCPPENTPAVSTSPSTPVVTSEPTSRPYSTNTAPFASLSASQTTPVVLPSTHLPSPTTTSSATISATVAPSSPPGSSPPASCSSPSKQVNPAGLIAGLIVGFTVLALMMALVIFLLWRRRLTRDISDEDPILPVRSLRATALSLPQKRTSNSLTVASPNTDEPAPPVPTSPRPWRESLAAAGLADHARDGGRPSPRAAANDSNTAAPAPTVELDAPWAAFWEEPEAFHGLSAPPRSREGSRSGLGRTASSGE